MEVRSIKSSSEFIYIERICLENLFVSNTHRAIIDRISEPVLRLAQVHMSTAVHSIDTQPKREQGKKVVLTTTNGFFDFDQVVVTIPLGCLKMRTLKFSPELPSSLTSAINHASYSHLEKVLINFPAAFWEGSGSIARNIGEASPTFGHHFPTFTHFLRPNYVPEEQRSWTLEMAALSSPAVFGLDAKPVLEFYLWGSSAAHVSSVIANLSPVSQRYYEIIDRLFRPFYSRLPNYKEEHSECVPLAVLATNWQKDEFAGNGSYTNFKTPEGERQLEVCPMIDDGVRTMRHGMPDRGIWFAGEHTAPFVALGTSTGAYWSGEAAAIRIIESHRPSTKPEPGK